MPVSKCSNDKWRIGSGECKFHSEEKAENAFKHWIETKEEANPVNFNPEDVIKMDVPLMIRVFEYIKEDVKDDVEIHEISARLISLSAMGRALNMDDYNQIIPSKNPEIERMKELSGLRKA